MSIYLRGCSRARISAFVSCLLAATLLFMAPASTAIVPSGMLPDRAVRSADFDALPPACSQPVDSEWRQKVNSIQWVAYSSPNPDPGTGYYRPTADAITNDLAALRKAGFTGLITYASSGIMGKQFLTIAESLGYQGILMGIWSPGGQDEIDNAISAAAMPIVLGYSIGNEGLGETRGRYSPLELCSAISSLRGRTGKPVATSEDIEAYYRWPELLSVGDWVFPISHPYWHFTKVANDAIQWEQDQYSALLERTDRFVFFKEVGLPTAGAPGLSEANQDAYYRGLAHTDVRFAYFEGFDQPSKTGASVEPHWGIFNSDLTPKLLAWNLMGYRTFTGGVSKTWSEECSRRNDAQCTSRSAGTLAFVGNDRDGIQFRALISFDTSDLPDNSIVTAVKLKVRSAGIVGVDPVNRRRSLLVDLCTPPENPTGAHPALAATRTASCIRKAGRFSDPPNSGWYTASLEPPSLASLNLRGASLFRVRVDGTSAHDTGRAYLELYTALASEADSPILLVKYRLP